MQYEVSEGWVGKVKQTKDKESTNFYMWLTVDGQKQRRATGTSDYDEAYEKLQEWRAQAKIGFRQDAKLRYEELRDDYLGSGKTLASGVQRDLDAFFKEMRVSAIGGHLEEFRTWRESLEHVLEYKQETLAKEIELRKLRVGGKVTAAELAKITKEATKWVENGVKATTDKRLVYLRAILRHAFKVTNKISNADIPYFPIRGKQVDNVKQGKFSEQDLANIIRKIPQHERIIHFLYLTGMRSGQAKSITWDMIDEDNVLRMSGFLTKNKKPYSLALTNSKGEAYPATKFLVERKNKPHGETVFEVEGLREDWRTACAELKLGYFEKKTRVYRGAQLHDFRRTAATNLTNRGVATTNAMEVTGHKTDSMFQRYNIGSLDAQRKALDAVS
jgi:integrase